MNNSMEAVDINKTLIISIVGPLMNKVKLCMLNAKKNRRLAEKL